PRFAPRPVEMDRRVVARLRREVAVRPRIPRRIPFVEMDPVPPCSERATKAPVRRRVAVAPRTRDAQSQDDQFHGGVGCRVDGGPAPVAGVVPPPAPQPPDPNAPPTPGSRDRRITPPQPPGPYRSDAHAGG